MISQTTALKQLDFLNEKGRHMRLAAEGWRNEWQRLVSIVLSARTRDEVTILVCERMFEKFPTMEEFSKLEVAHIKRLIQSINFFENKAVYLYEMTKRLIEEFGGEVPREATQLITLPGVGNKTVNVFLAEDGEARIGVDTHVNYISNYLGWANSTNPDIVERELQALFPEETWASLNKIIVRFGKTYTSRKQKNIWLDYIKENIT